jgi:hypothetical protein
MFNLSALPGQSTASLIYEAIFTIIMYANIVNKETYTHDTRISSSMCLYNYTLLPSISVPVDSANLVLTCLYVYEQISQSIGVKDILKLDGVRTAGFNYKDNFNNFQVYHFV